MSTRADTQDITVVHLMRHGEVENPEGILYGRLPGYHLSDLGRRMAERVADHLASRDVTYVVASPLERAQETATPIAKAHGLDVATDERLIEAANVFEGRPSASATARCAGPPTGSTWSIRSSRPGASRTSTRWCG
jgi:broad specificity phosphatase PhoE